MLLAIWNCIIIPFDVSFGSDQEESTLYSAFNIFVDLCFLTDIILNFRTTIVDKKTGFEIV